MIYRKITEGIGNTPLLWIDPAVHGLRNVDVYAKLEYMNPFGSVKDRIAWGIVAPDIASIQEKKQTIIEMSSGNTAKALQAVASIHGVSFKTITNRIKVPEQKAILRMLGAHIEELPGTTDCYDPSDPNDPYVYIQREIASAGDAAYFTSQYTNERNLETHYATTGEEILRDVPVVDYFFGGVGTSGSTRGVAQKLLERNPNLKTVGIAASKHDFIPGIRNQDELMEVGLFDPAFYAQMQMVRSSDAVDRTLELVRGTGMMCGPTTGACYEGMLSYLRPIDATLTERKVAVFIACDRLEWYVSYVRERRPDIFQEAAPKQSIHALSDEQIAGANVLMPEQALEWIGTHHPLIIDIRGHQAYHLLHIRDSLNLPDAHLRPLIENGDPFPKERPLLLVCPRGERSRVYAAYLATRGYNAFSLQGGLYGWKDTGLPLHTLTYCAV